jgi:acyl carrier protein
MSSTDFNTLVNVMRRTFGRPNLVVTRETTSDEVPGWDSINHTLLMIEIDEAFGVMLRSDLTAKLANVGELYDLLQAEVGKRGGAG